MVLQSLLKAQEKLGKEKLFVIVVPMETLQMFSDNAKEDLKPVPVVKNQAEVVKKFESIIMGKELSKIVIDYYQFKRLLIVIYSKGY